MITVERAIEVLKENNPPPMDSWSEELTEAVSLSIEGLKELDALRKVLTGLGNSLLPGETKGHPG